MPRKPKPGHVYHSWLRVGDVSFRLTEDEHGEIIVRVGEHIVGRLGRDGRKWRVWRNGDTSPSPLRFPNRDRALAHLYPVEATP